MSILATWSHVVQSRDVSPHNFDGLAMSGLAFSVAPLIVVFMHSQFLATNNAVLFRLSNVTERLKSRDLTTRHQMARVDIARQREVKLNDA